MKTEFDRAVARAVELAQGMLTEPADSLEPNQVAMAQDILTLAQVVEDMDATLAYYAQPRNYNLPAGGGKCVDHGTRRDRHR